MRAIEIGARTGAHHERTKQCAPLQILLAQRARKRGVTWRQARGRARGVDLVAGREAVKRGKYFVGDFRLNGNQIERGDANRSARAHALGGHVEELPRSEEHTSELQSLR